MDHFINIGLLILLYGLVWYAISILLKNNGIADIAWGLGFCVIAVYGWISSGHQFPGGTLVLIMVVFWGLRLGGYIFWRSIGKSEDWRYKKWREEWEWFYLRSYLQVWLLQGLLTIVVSLPVINIMYSSQPPIQLSWIEYTGAVIWIIGFLWEAISDYQLYVFKRNPENKGKIMTTGLWSYSRHPNYFGEIFLWFGIFIFSIPYRNNLLSLVGFLMITYLITKVSGVTMLESKYKDNPEYQEYKKKTWALIPKLF